MNSFLSRKWEDIPELDQGVRSDVEMMIDQYSYPKASAFFPKNDIYKEWSRVFAYSTEAQKSERDCKKFICFTNFCIAFEQILAIIGNDERLNDIYDHPDDLDNYVKNVQLPLNVCCCKYIADAVKKFYSNTEEIRKFREKLFYTRKNFGKTDESYRKLVRDYAYKFVQAMSDYKDRWAGTHYCDQQNCYLNTFFSTKLGVYEGNYCVQDEKFGTCFFNMTHLKKYFRDETIFYPFIAEENYSGLAHFFKTRIPQNTIRQVDYYLPKFIQVGKNLIIEYQKNFIQDNITSDSIKNIEQFISELYADIGLTEVRDTSRIKPNEEKYYWDVINDAIQNFDAIVNMEPLNPTICYTQVDAQRKYIWNEFIPLFKSLFVMTGGDFSIFDAIANFIVSVYAGRKINTCIEGKPRLFVFVTNNKDFVSSWIKAIFDVKYRANGTEEQLLYYINPDNGKPYHVTDYSLEELSDDNNVGKFLQDKFNGNILNVTVVDNEEKLSDMSTIRKLVNGEVVTGKNAILGNQRYSSDSTYAFVVDHAFQLSVLDDNLIEYRVINISDDLKSDYLFEKSEAISFKSKVFVFTKFVLYGLLNNYPCRNDDIDISRIEDLFFEKCGTIQSDDIKKISVDNACGLKAFTEAINQFSRHILGVDVVQTPKVEWVENEFKRFGIVVEKRVSNAEFNRAEKEKGYSTYTSQATILKGFSLFDKKTVVEITENIVRDIREANSCNELDEYKFVCELWKILNLTPNYVLSLPNKTSPDEKELINSIKIWTGHE